MKPNSRLNNRTVEWNPLNYWDNSLLYWNKINVNWDSGIVVENIVQNSRIKTINVNSKIKQIKSNIR